MSRWLAVLTRLFPAAFRARFGDEMRDQIARDARQARRHGIWATVRFAVATAIDLATSAFAERTRPSHFESPAPTSLRSRPRRSLMDALLQDFRFALRSLRHTPGFTLVAVLTLALAIGVNAGIFSVVDTVLIHPLPLHEPDRLVQLSASAPGEDLPDEFRLASEFVVHWDEHSELVEEISTFNWFTATLRAEGRTERVVMSAPTPSLFRTLGVPPVLGRGFADDDPEDTTVISHALWTSWLGSDPNVLGRRISAAGEDRTIIGVMPEGFWFPRGGVLLWLNSPLDPAEISPGRFGTNVVARIADGVGEEELVEELTLLAKQLPERFGGSARYAEVIERFRAVVHTIEEHLLGSAQALWILLGAVGVVLLVACANVSNLLLVRVQRRQPDFAVRQAVGASRAQLLRLQLIESLVVATLGGVLAVLLAGATVPILVSLAPGGLPRLGEAAITPRTLVFTFLVSLLAAAICGLWPALRGTAPGLLTLRAGSRELTGNWGRNGLVVAQTALALVLLIGSGLLVRSLWQLRQVDPGYDLDNLYTFQIAPESEALTDAESYARFHAGFIEHIRALPGVELVGLMENVPLSEGVGTAPFQVEGESVDEDAGVRLNYTWAGADYFQAAGIELVAGRTFSPRDDVEPLGSVLLSELAAERLFPGQDPIGRRVRGTGDEEWGTVVGVVGDVLQYDFRDRPQATLYYPMVGPAEEPRVLSSPAYVVRTDSNERAENIGPEIRALVEQHAPNAPMYSMATMRELAADNLAGLSFNMLTLGFAAGLALLLGAIGLYGVLSFVVAQRTREIGLRMAMGAGPRRVQRLVVGQGLRVVLLGLSLGLAASFAATRLLDDLLFRTEAIDPGVFLAMTVAMLTVAFLATWLPARRASRVDPMVSLRSE